MSDVRNSTFVQAADNFINKILDIATGALDKAVGFLAQGAENTVAGISGGFSFGLGGGGSDSGVSAPAIESSKAAAVGQEKQLTGHEADPAMLGVMSPQNFSGQSIDRGQAQGVGTGH